LRKRINAQPGLDFHPEALPETLAYYEKYERIDEILRACPQITDRIHRDLETALESTNKDGRSSRYSADQILRIAIAQSCEGESLRNITVRIDESPFLRKFTRIYNDKMISHSTFCSLRNKISFGTWCEINEQLATYAIDNDVISGDKLRLDTTVVETNVHWPTDSSLLWDVYRTTTSLLRRMNKQHPWILEGRRLHPRRAKKLAQKIARRLGKRKAGPTGAGRDAAKDTYSRLISSVSQILSLADEVVSAMSKQKRTSRGLAEVGTMLEVGRLADHVELGRRVVSQAERRVLHDERVPSDEKVYSIFEPHTELIKRGKAGKPIEFGHKILLHQVEGCFITSFEVFNPKPDESMLLPSAVSEHERLFGYLPEVLTADKGFYSSMDDLRKLEEKIDVVSVCKKGRRTEEEEAREHGRKFKLAQKFRAGIEGSISVLKRCFGLFRSLRKSWEHFAAHVGNSVFAHNLCVLARC